MLDIESFVSKMNNIGFRIKRNGRGKIGNYDGYIIEMSNKNKDIHVATKTDDTNDVIGVIISDNGNKLMDITHVKDFNTLYTLVENNLEELKGNYKSKKIVSQLDNLINKGNNFNIKFEYNGNILFKGLTREDMMIYNLQDMLTDKILKGEIEEYFGLTLLVNEDIKIKNITKVEDVKPFLDKVKEYLIRVDSNYKDTTLETIYAQIKDEVDEWMEPEDVIKSIYDYPVLGEEYEAPESKEINYEPIKETAKKIKKKLRERYKETKFSVTTQGATRIDVKWVDFPTVDKVEDLVSIYNGKHTQQSFGDYGHDTVDVGYIDPDDKKRYTSPKYLFCKPEYSEEYERLIEYALESRILNIYGIGYEDYNYNSQWYQFRKKREVYENEKIRNIETKESMEQLIKDYEKEFEETFIKRIGRDLKELGITQEFGLNNICLNRDGHPELIINIKGNIPEEVYNNPVIKGYGIKVKSGEFNKRNEKGGINRPKFKENKDGKDNIRLNRFVKYLKDNKYKFKKGDNKNLPNYVVVNVEGNSISIAPTFVVHLDSKKLMYNKNNIEHDNKTLINNLNKIGIKDKKLLKDITVAYVRSNDLRIKNVSK